LVHFDGQLNNKNEFSAMSDETTNLLNASGNYIETLLPLFINYGLSAFGANGISFPFPQRDVHLFQSQVKP
jgi:small-conductance mechanosensitive channel